MPLLQSNPTLWTEGVMCQPLAGAHPLFSTPHPHLLRAGWAWSQGKSEPSMRGQWRGCKTLNGFSLKRHFIYFNNSIRGAGLPEASRGCTVEAMWPEETIQDLLALAGPLLAEWSGHEGPFGALCRSQGEVLRQGQQNPLSPPPMLPT